MPNHGARVIHYYGSGDEDELEELEEDNEEESQPPIAAIPRENHFSQFIELPKVPRRAVGEDRPKQLIDYSSSQLLTSDQHLNKLERITENKERVQQEKLQK